MPELNAQSLAWDCAGLRDLWYTGAGDATRGNFCFGIINFSDEVSSRSGFLREGQVI